MEIFDEVGKVNPFNYTVSNTWNSTWPKYENEWKANVTKAIVGQITLDEYKAYVEKINNTPEMKKAYKEFTESYKSFTGK